MTFVNGCMIIPPSNLYDVFLSYILLVKSKVSQSQHIKTENFLNKNKLNIKLFRNDLTAD